MPDSPSESKSIRAREALICALDVDSLEQAVALVERLNSFVGHFKVGLELLTAEGAPRVVDRLHRAGARLFFDGKFDDIPNTVAGATRSLARLGVSLFDVHASSGIDSVRAAAAAKGAAKLLAVTVLTSMRDEECLRIFGSPTREKVVQFAREAIQAGADGIVCSPLELAWLATDPSLRSCLKVTPGVRPVWAETGDQKRVLTPYDALRAGATHLVIGRPILRPPQEIGDPAQAAQRIVREMEEAFS